jgi:hypothetical protein
MSFVRKIAPLAGAALILTAFASGASAYQCKKLNVTGVNVSTAQAAALAGARANWTGKAKAAYGLSWSVWSIAASPTQTCAPGANGTFICTAKAKPCNYVVQ